MVRLRPRSAPTRITTGRYARATSAEPVSLLAHMLRALQPTCPGAANTTCLTRLHVSCTDPECMVLHSSMAPVGSANGSAYWGNQRPLQTDSGRLACAPTHAGVRANTGYSGRGVILADSGNSPIPDLVVCMGNKKRPTGWSGVRLVMYFQPACPTLGDLAGAAYGDTMRASKLDIGRTGGMGVVKVAMALQMGGVDNALA